MFLPLAIRLFPPRGFNRELQAGGGGGGLLSLFMPFRSDATILGSNTTQPHLNIKRYDTIRMHLERDDDGSSWSPRSSPASHETQIKSYLNSTWNVSVSRAALVIGVNSERFSIENAGVSHLLLYRGNQRLPIGLSASEMTATRAIIRGSRKLRSRASRAL